jgi:hypothetical protein
MQSGKPSVSEVEITAPPEAAMSRRICGISACGRKPYLITRSAIEPKTVLASPWASVSPMYQS